MRCNGLAAQLGCPWFARAVALALFVSLVSSVEHARAEAGQLSLESDFVARYRTPVQAHPIRAAVEELGLLVLGLTHYFYNSGANEIDWRYAYDWPSFRRKLDGTGYAFDTNFFETNYLAHPASGTLYYLAARGNRLTPFESFAYAVVASTLWEVVGEFREQASINDLWVTPVTGFAFGEATHQLGAFFDRSCESTGNAVLGSVFAPSKALHDYFDGVAPLRDTQCDQLGLSLVGEHEFDLSLGVAAVKPIEGPDQPLEAALQLRLHTRVIALPTYGVAGNGSQTFADANVSELFFETSFAGGLTDLTFGAGVMPFGVHQRSLAPARVGSGLVGHEFMLGLWIGLEYGVHRFEPRQTDDLDRFFALQAPGASFEYRRHVGGVIWEFELRASATFAGADAFALPSYLVVGSENDVTSVARMEGYNHAAGLTVFPRARVIMQGLELGAALHATRVWGLRMADRYGYASDVSIVEGKRRAEFWVRMAPTNSPLRVTVSCAALQRWGTLANTRDERAELRLAGTLGVVL